MKRMWSENNFDSALDEKFAAVAASKGYLPVENVTIAFNEEKIKLQSSQCVKIGNIVFVTFTAESLTALTTSDVIAALGEHPERQMLFYGRAAGGGNPYSISSSGNITSFSNVSSEVSLTLSLFFVAAE